MFPYSKEVVATYTYDAWGNCTITNKTSANIGTINSFRYRGYYQDNETGFYYLQTRYYDPEIRRFINADNLELIPLLTQRVGQLNLYAYCNDNPVSYTDESGGIAITLALGSLVAALILAGGAIYIESTTHAVSNVLIGAGNAIAETWGYLKSYLLSEWEPGSWPGDDPTIPLGDGFIWRGPGEVGSRFCE